MLPGSIAIFGASSVYGVGDPEGGFITRFRKWYDARRDNGVVYNLGIPAENTEYLLKRFKSENARRDPILTLFEIGANDAYRHGSETASNAVPLEQFRDNCRKLVDQAFETSLVGIITPYPMDDDANPHGWGGEIPHAYYLQKDIIRYVSVLKEVATERDIPVLDLFTSWLEQDLYKDRLAEDGLHANAKGHALIAEELQNFVETYFSNLIR